MKDNNKWYIVQVVSNYEQKVKEALENREFDDEETGIKEIYLPYKFSLTKNNKVKKKPMFPGYLYVKVDMTDESWYIIRNVEYVTGIVGSSGQRTKPTPITETQIEKIKFKEKEFLDKFKSNKLKEEKDKKHYEEMSGKKDALTQSEINFEVGDLVKISEGEFFGNEGTVVSISFIKQSASIEVEMFGRKTILEIELSKIKK